MYVQTYRLDSACHLEILPGPPCQQGPCHPGGSASWRLCGAIEAVSIAQCIATCVVPRRAASCPKVTSFARRSPSKADLSFI